MEFKKEMTAPVVSVGADTEQSSQTFTDHSITTFHSKINSFVLKGGNTDG